MNVNVNAHVSGGPCPSGNLRFAALQSDAGRSLLKRAGRDPDDISSIVLVVWLGGQQGGSEVWVGEEAR